MLVEREYVPKLFPLPTAYFDVKRHPVRPQLQKEFIDESRKHCNRMISFATEESYISSNWVWVPLNKSRLGGLNGAKTFLQTKKNSDDLVRIAGFATCEGTLDEVANIFKAMDTTKGFRSQMKELDPNVIDCAMLHTLVGRTTKSPNDTVCVKWTGFSSPSKYLFKRKDMCYVECQANFVTSEGIRGWTRALYSVAIDSCPLLSTLDFSRMSNIVNGYVFLETKRPEMLHVTYIGEEYTTGHVQRLLLANAMTSGLLLIPRLEAFIKKTRLAQLRFLKDSQLIPLNQRDNCIVCSRRFGYLGWRYNCLQCGEVICSHCSRSWDIGQVNVKKKIRICTPCFLTTKKTSTIRKNSMVKETVCCDSDVEDEHFDRNIEQISNDEIEL